MLYTMIYNNKTEETETKIFYDLISFYTETSPPEIEFSVIDTEKPPVFNKFYNGRPARYTYAEQKAALHDLAVEYSNSFGADHVEGMSYCELAEIQNYFETYGRRYGLLTEFRENAII